MFFINILGPPVEPLPSSDEEEPLVSSNHIAGGNENISEKQEEFVFRRNKYSEYHKVSIILFFFIYFCIISTSCVIL